MLFKGTKRRPTAREISEEIEGIGGVMNAGTDKELTVYWAKVGDHRFAATLDILADSLLNSLMDPKELEKEREVILEELAMTEDSPADIVNILIDEVVWPHQPLGRDTGGTPDSVKAIARDDVIRYMEQLYVPQNTVVAIAGNAVENVVGVQLALRNRPDFAIAVIVNSSLQVALALTPVIMFASLFFATNLTLVFPTLLAISLLLAAFVTAVVVYDGESTWPEGVVLVGLYVVIASAFWWG